MDNRRPQVRGRMHDSVTKKVRLTPARAVRLRQLARESGVTERDIIRCGIELVERVRYRHQNMHELVQMAEGTEPAGSGSSSDHDDRSGHFHLSPMSD